MRRWDESAFDSYLPAEMVLAQSEIAVVVTDRLSNLLYVNAYAARLFRFTGDASRLIGASVLSLGFIEESDFEKADDLARQVLRGRSWDGTFASTRADSARVLIRAFAVPLRHPSGAIDGMVILARETHRRGGEREQDRIGLLERVGVKLAGSLELGLLHRPVPG